MTYSYLFALCIQVPLGIILKSEINHADMIAILEDLHKYVPMVTSVTKTSVTVEGKVEDCSVTEDRFHRMLLGGDQLTAARARGAQRIRSNSERSLDRLEGFEPTSEDWHAKGILLAVCICVHMSTLYLPTWQGIIAPPM